MQRKLIYAVLVLAIFSATLFYKPRLREQSLKVNLGEATIGDVDAGSFMLKLALLGGARGVAANVLWTRAIELQKAQDWDKMEATINLITKLQPHFLSVWTFQGWNLAYNVSVEWDSPEDKYEWIKKGIKFLRDGVAKNQKSPDLIWDTAWTYYHKLGFADESIILRKLFRDDVDESFKRDPLDNNVYNDNFQLGRGWFTKSVNLVDAGEIRIQEGTEETIETIDAPQQRKGRPGDLAFRSMPAHSQTRYAAGLEKESIVGVPATFGEVAKNEWSKSLNEWMKFGTYKFQTHNLVMVDGKLQKEDVYIDDATIPDKYNKLTENQRYWAKRWADQMNYPYWKDRCKAEMTDEGMNARRLFYEGTKAYKSADFPTAVERFKQGLKIWDVLLKKHQQYRDDDLNQKDTGLIVKRYAKACQQLGIDVPKDTPFLDLLRLVEQDNTVDPFDAVEMMSRGASAMPGGGQSGGARPAAGPGK
jgi:hypothetical protein